MKFLVKLLILITSTLTVTSIFAYEFYLGADALQTDMKFRKYYGSNIFQRKHKGINLFVGYKLNKLFNLEAGYELQERRTYTFPVLGDQKVAGWHMPGVVGTGIFTSKVKQQHPYVGITINKQHAEDRTSSLLFGVSLSRVKAYYTMLQPTFYINEPVSFATTKPIPMARAAITCKLCNNLFSRFFVTWRGTSMIKMIAKENTPANLVRFNNYISFGVGLFWG